MNKVKSVLRLAALFMVYQSFGQSFVLQETNVKKNTTQCINLAKKCRYVLLRQQSLYTLAISGKSTLTANSVNMLADKFTNFFPKESAKGEGLLLDRGFENPRDQIVKLTYAFLPPGKYETTDYAQIVVIFDVSGSSPTVLDIQVKNKIVLGLVRITEREKLKFKPQPVTQTKVAENPAAKPATTTTEPKSNCQSGRWFTEFLQWYGRFQLRRRWRWVQLGEFAGRIGGSGARSAARAK